MSQSGENGPFWLSRKFWYTVLAAGVFLALALTGTMQFSSSETMGFLLGLLGIGVGSHAATDIAGILGRAFGSNPPPTVLPPLVVKPEDTVRADSPSLSGGLPYFNVQAPVPPVVTTSSDGPAVISSDDTRETKIPPSPVTRRSP